MAATLGKFPKTKLAIVTASVLSVAVIGGAFAMPQAQTSKAEGQPAAAAPAAQPGPGPQQKIRRIYVIRRTREGTSETPQVAAPSQQPAPAAPPPQAQAPAPKPKPAPAPVTNSRGS